MKWYQNNKVIAAVAAAVATLITVVALVAGWDEATVAVVSLAATNIIGIWKAVVTPEQTRAKDAATNETLGGVGGQRGAVRVLPLIDWTAIGLAVLGGALSVIWDKDAAGIGLALPTMAWFAWRWWPVERVIAGAWGFSGAIGAAVLIVSAVAPQPGCSAAVGQRIVDGLTTTALVGGKAATDATFCTIKCAVESPHAACYEGCWVVALRETGQGLAEEVAALVPDLLAAWRGGRLEYVEPLSGSVNGLVDVGLGVAQLPPPPTPEGCQAVKQAKGQVYVVKCAGD